MPKLPPGTPMGITDDEARGQATIDESLRPGDIGYVGKGHPPREHCFKPGQSGNRKGRKPGRHRHKTLMRKYLEMVVRTPNGREVSMEELALNGLRKRVAEGDIKAIKLWTELVEKYCGSDSENPSVQINDRRMMALERAMARMDTGHGTVLFAAEDHDHADNHTPEGECGDA